MRINNYKTKLDMKSHMAYLVQEKGFNYNGMPDRMCNKPDLIAKMMRDCYSIHEETEECVYLVCTDIKSKLIGTFLISRGTVNASCVGPRELFVKALLCNAVNLILVHNHPSQLSLPSSDDIRLTERVKKAGELVWFWIN